jgi:CheY-like chemotaxis protein
VRPIHILLVDDDDLAVLNVQRAIERAGFDATVTAVAGGTEALQVLRGGTLEQDRLLVLTDLHMPGLSGLDLLSAIRSDPTLSDLPVVILTASTLAAHRKSAFDLHAAGYFVKPDGPTRHREVIQWLYNYWASSEFGRDGGRDGG